MPVDGRVSPHGKNKMYIYIYICICLNMENGIKAYILGLIPFYVLIL